MGTWLVLAWFVSMVLFVIILGDDNDPDGRS